MKSSLISHPGTWTGIIIPDLHIPAALAAIKFPVLVAVEGEETQPNATEPRAEECEKDEAAKMTDAAMCKQNHPDSNHNRIIRNSDKRNIERNKGSEEDEDEEAAAAAAAVEEDEEGQVLNDRGSPVYEVPNGSQLVRRHIQGPQNLETVLRVNGVVKKEKHPVINDKRETNLGLQQLLLLEKPKTNGDCSPSLKESKTPVIIVKSVHDLNNGDFRGKEEKREASKGRTDTGISAEERHRRHLPGARGASER
ncbi:UNVERIFIED_CONTAM: hypothetical protein PYX00_008278 [Menopon gallinae]|uniref:Uncharacterized protein n=1 Tax=Menopon gallinae TaxID=328185 RepID=A0AAW2HNM1_9NEOP